MYVVVITRTRPPRARSVSRAPRTTRKPFHLMNAEMRSTDSALANSLMISRPTRGWSVPLTSNALEVRGVSGRTGGRGGRGSRGLSMIARRSSVASSISSSRPRASGACSRIAWTTTFARSRIRRIRTSSGPPWVAKARRTRIETYRATNASASAASNSRLSTRSASNAARRSAIRRVTRSSYRPGRRSSTRSRVALPTEVRNDESAS